MRESTRRRQIAGIAGIWLADALGTVLVYLIVLALQTGVSFQVILARAASIVGLSAVALSIAAGVIETSIAALLGAYRLRERISWRAVVVFALASSATAAMIVGGDLLFGRTRAFGLRLIPVLALTTFATMLAIHIWGDGAVHQGRRFASQRLPRILDALVRGTERPLAVTQAVIARVPARVLIVLVAIVLAGVVYLPSLTPGFEFDDISVWQIVAGIPTPWQVLAHTYGPTPGSANLAEQGARVWRPLFDLAWWFEVRAFGTNGSLFHVANVALHGLTGGLVGVVAYELTRRRLMAGIFPAALVVVQPFPQAVAWNSGALSNVFATTTYLVALLAIVRAARADALGPRLRWIAVGMFAFAVSLGTYELALPGVLLIFICTIALDRGTWRKRVLRASLTSVPFALITGLYLVIRHAFLGEWVGVYGASTVLRINMDTLTRLGTVVRAFLRPTHFTLGDRTAEFPLLLLYWVGLAALVLAAVFRPERRAAFVGLAFAAIGFLPFIGVVRVSDVLDPSRYLYTTEAGLALAAGIVLATASRRLIARAAFTCLFVGCAGLLLRNEAAWHQAGNMVASTMTAAAGGPILVFGVPSYAFEGAYTFGPGKQYLERYPGARAHDIEFGGPVRDDRRLLYWDGESLRDVGAPFLTWQGGELAAWRHADAAHVTASADGAIFESSSGDPWLFTPDLTIEGPRAQVVTVTMDPIEAPCKRGQVIWRTTSGHDYLAGFELLPGRQVYVLVGPSDLRSEQIALLRIDPMLCPGRAVVYSIGLGGIESVGNARQ